MFYGIGETFNNFVSLLYTKVFWKGGRLVRLPVRARNKKNIEYGVGFTCGQYCRITAGEEKGSIIIGKNFIMGDMCQIEGIGGVQIGDNVLCASKIFIGTTSHGNYSSERDASDPDTPPNIRVVIKKKVVIGNNVWVGNNVSILPGVTIGNGVIIGANSVVTHSIPSNCIAVGVPAQIVKKYNKDLSKWESV